VFFGNEIPDIIRRGFTGIDTEILADFAERMSNEP
jgi:hypothetical protein